MKSEIKEAAEQADITFPCLMRHKLNTNLIVWFMDRNTGIVVNSGDGGLHALGLFRQDWNSALDTVAWQSFTGKIILSND